MTKSELNKFGKLLQNKAAELDLAVKDRGGILAQKEPDPLDQVQRAAELSLAISNMDRDTHTRCQVHEALRRLDEGNYGVCQRCGEDIDPRRLNAVPWTPFCFECQERADRAVSDGVGLRTEVQLA